MSGFSTAWMRDAMNCQASSSALRRWANSQSPMISWAAARITFWSSGES